MALILNLLEGVRQTGPHSWIARCPAHDDKSPSLSLREHDDGRWLMHCFAGCDAIDICGAIGIELADLFPDRLYHKAKPAPMRMSASDAFKCLAREAGVVAIAAADIAEGRPLDDRDSRRVVEAAGRIGDALLILNG